MLSFFVMAVCCVGYMFYALVRSMIDPTWDFLED